MKSKRTMGAVAAAVTVTALGAVLAFTLSGGGDGSHATDAEGPLANQSAGEGGRASLTAPDIAVAPGIPPADNATSGKAIDMPAGQSGGSTGSAYSTAGSAATATGGDSGGSAPPVDAARRGERCRHCPRAGSRDQRHRGRAVSAGGIKLLSGRRYPSGAFGWASYQLFHS